MQSGWFTKITLVLQNKKDDQPVILKLQEYAETYLTRGFDDYYGKMKNEGLPWNRKRVLRVYRLVRLGLRRKHKRRLPARIKEPLEQQQRPNRSYSMDFVSDVLMTGRKVRVLNIMDDYTRESLSAHADYSLPGNAVVQVLEQIAEERELPAQIRVDNGPEFLSKVFTGWCKQNEITIKYIQPGKPTQNAYIERLNRTFREDVLDAYQFESLEELRMLCDDWQYKYNNYHPHKALKRKTPLMKGMEYEEAHLSRTIEQDQQNYIQASEHTIVHPR